MAFQAQNVLPAELKRFKEVWGKWASTYTEVRGRFPTLTMEELVEVALLKSGSDHILSFLETKFKADAEEIDWLRKEIGNLTQVWEFIRLINDRNR